MSPYRWQTLQGIEEQGVIGVLRSPDRATAVADASTCVDAGLRVVEVSLVTPGALGGVEELRRRHPDALIGAGTVIDAVSARQAVDAGARFLVAPSLHEEVLATALRLGIPVVPGVATPSEALTALAHGADAVKLFPAGLWTPSTLADLLTALPHLPVIPTGGVTAETAVDWIRAGAIAVGMGGALLGDDPDLRSSRVVSLLAQVRAARQA